MANVYPDHQNENGEMVERLADEEPGVVRFRFLDGREDIMAEAAFLAEFEHVGKDNADNCEHDVHPDEICSVCD